MPHKEQPVFVHHANPATIAPHAARGLGMSWLDGYLDGHPPGA